MFAIDLEGYAFLHKDVFIRSMEMALAKLETKNKVNSRDVAATNMSKLIKDEFGLAVEFEVVPYPNQLAVLVPALNRNNPLLTEDSAEFLYDRHDKAYKDGSKFKGTVDLEGLKVGGDFSEIQSTIIISSQYISKGSNVTKRQIIAGICHELGHLMSYFLASGRMTRDSMVMNEALKNLDTAPSKEMKIDILRATGAELGSDIENIESLADSKNPEVYAAAIATSMVDGSISQLGFNIYDERSFEQLADQFAVRIGLGKDLAALLNTITGTGLFKHSDFRSFPVHAMISLAKISFTAIALAVPFGIINTGLPLYMIGYNDPQLQKYDRPGERFRKIREQMNDRLRDRNISDSEKQTLLDSIEYLKEMEDKTSENRGVMEFLAGEIMPMGRKKRRDTKLQLKMESMVNNGFFEAAARLG